MDHHEEFFHAPSDEEFWSESHYLDFVGDDLHGNVRIGFYPNRDSMNLFAFIVDDSEIYAVRDDAIPPADGHGLTVHRETDDWQFGLHPIEVGRRWRVELTGTALKCTSAREALAGEGDPVELSVEFTATGRHDPFFYSENPDFPSEPTADRYEQATTVEGMATIDGTDIAFEGPGERDHSWGRRRWTDAEWLWISGAFEDGTAYNHLAAWGPGNPDERVINGFWFDGEVHPLTDASLHPDSSFGTETTRAWLDGNAPTFELDFEWDGGATTLTVEPFATTPVDWTDERAGRQAVLARSAARQTRDGDVSGRGYLENMTQFSLG